MASVTESILLSVQTRGTESLDAAAKSFDSVSKSADRAGKEIDGAGKRADRAGRRAEKLRGRLGDVATMFRDSGDGGMIFADALDAASVATTPLGVGILGVVAGLGAAKLAFDALSASVSLYIETNAEAAAASDRLDVAIGELNESVVDLVLGEGGLTLITNNLTRAATDAAARLDALREASDGARGSADVLQDRIGLVRLALQATSTAAPGVAAALDGLASSVSLLASANGTLITSNSSLISSFGGVATAAQNAAGAVAAAASQAASDFAVILGLQESAQFKVFKQVTASVAASPIGKAGAAFYKSISTPARRGGGGGGAAAARERERQEASRAEALEITGGLFGDPDFLAAREAEGGSILAADRRAREAAKAAAKDAERRAAAAAKDAERRAEARRQALEKEAAAVRKLAGTFRTELQGSLAGLAVTASATFGEMTAGAISAAGAMRSLAQEILNVGAAIGRTAAQRGVEGVLAGTAGAGGVLAGGLGIAAGAGLLGAILARRQQRRGGRRTGDSTARLAESIDRLEQTLRPDRADTPVTLNAEIVIAGRTVQQELTGALDSIVRTRSSRELFRAGIGR